MKNHRGDRFWKKNLKKFCFEIINISRNPKNHVFGPKMVISGPRTPKFCILVTNYGTKDMFLEFSKNPQKWPFLNFHAPKTQLFANNWNKFRILVTNYGRKPMFLEFLKNHQKCPFLNFGSIFGDFAKTPAARPLVTRFRYNLYQNFSFFM